MKNEKSGQFCNCSKIYVKLFLTPLKLIQSKWGTFLQHSSPGIQLNMNKNDVPQLIDDLVFMKVNLLSVNPVNSLEDFFLSLTTQPSHVEIAAN